MNLAPHSQFHNASCIQRPSSQGSSLSEMIKTPVEEEEEEMEFIIVRDVSPSSEWDRKSERAPTPPRSPTPPPPASFKSAVESVSIALYILLQMSSLYHDLLLNMHTYY